MKRSPGVKRTDSGVLMRPRGALLAAVADLHLFGVETVSRCCGVVNGERHPAEIGVCVAISLASVDE